MSFQVSPGVNISEIDLTTIVPAVSTTEGAVGGVFRWGPVEDRKLISSEVDLVNQFGKPDSNNFETFFTAADFLAYGNKLYVSRAADANAFNSAGIDGTDTDIQIKNLDQYNTGITIGANSYYVAKYPGDIGNSLKVSQCDSANAFSKTVNQDAGGSWTLDVSYAVGDANAVITLVDVNTSDSNVSANLISNTVLSEIQVGDYIKAGNTTIGHEFLKISAIGSVTSNTTGGSFANVTFSDTYNLSTNSSLNFVERYWEYFNVVNETPGTSPYTLAQGGAGDELHVVVIDEDGQFTGTPKTVLEVWSNLSRATDAKGEQGGSIYYKNVINNSSKYIWWGNHRSGLEANTAINMAVTDTDSISLSFTRGTDSVSESVISLGDLSRAYDQFKSAEDVDVSIILGGKSTGGLYGEGLANYISDNITTQRKDCVGVFSPQYNDVVNAPFAETTNIIQFRNALRSNSYGILDSGYKYRYDKYNDVYRYTPLNGDIGGLMVRTDTIRDSWWSPAGFNRGKIKNIVKLAYNPNKADRDILYKANINPVVNFPGQGVVLYGDKTLLSKPSAFDRINVRRLFIVLEKAISNASKFTLFEFNDSFTRSQFRNLLEPYLRDIKGRRGIYDFKVVVDESNNTPEVIDRNEFIGDIYIKPARSINFIQLNFVAVRTGVDFEEIVGKF